MSEAPTKCIPRRKVRKILLTALTRAARQQLKDIAAEESKNRAIAPGDTMALTGEVTLTLNIEVNFQ